MLLIGCSGQPIYNLENEYVPTGINGESASLEQVKKAIIVGSKKRGWSPRVVKSGVIESRLLVRSHRAVVEISYSENSYSIRYVDSSNLDYKNGKIHKKYNLWVAKLSSSIQRELGVRAQQY